MDIGGSRVKSEPNVVPLCDILLVLLIIFMVITPMLLFDNEKVQLPHAENTTEEHGPSPDVTLTLRMDGSLFVNKVQVANTGDLEDRLSQEFRGFAGRVLYFKADTGLDYASVQEVLGVARRAGVERLAVVADRPILEQN